MHEKIIPNPTLNNKKLMKIFLHTGCGSENKSNIEGFNNDNWKEIRFDINESVKPDIVGTLTDMKSVETGSVDAVYSSHNIEHIYPHEVPIALREFYRVLKEDGMVSISCPDLQSVCEAVAQDKLLEPLYDSPTGPISPIDILYGHRQPISKGNEYMAHKGGFTYSTLYKAFKEVGFQSMAGGRRGYNLYLVAFKQRKPDEEIKKIVSQFIPNAKFT
ncbi:MAG: methyltransferase domain-containing protein [Candidatus Pacebacteria bacterium]|nr:methyltransferase domain-containing protein [Candidatus Paceibacterota bacterium]